MKAKKRRGHHRGLPQGMTYAEKLAWERSKQAAIERAAQSAYTKVMSNMQAQRIQWLDIVSMAEAFGIGPDRFKRFFARVIENSRELERMKAEVDEEYAWEKLRLRAAEVSGIDFTYIYEEGGDRP